jgi:Tol biopolymer transport system component
MAEQKSSTSSTSDYDLSILENLGVSAEVLKFFKEHPTRAAQASQEARNAWGMLTSNQAGCSYVTRTGSFHYNLNVGFALDKKTPNMLCLLSHLLQRPSTLAETEPWPTWQWLGEAFTRARKGAFTRFNAGQMSPDGLGSIAFIVGRSDKVMHSFRWVFQSGHFFVESDFQKLSAPPDEQEASLIAQLRDRPLATSLSNYQSVVKLETSMARQRATSSILQENPLVFARIYPFASLAHDNDKIVTYLRKVVKDKNAARVQRRLVVTLLNRLSTDDALERAVKEISSSVYFAELYQHPHPQLGGQAATALLNSLMESKKFEDARRISLHLSAKDPERHYLIAHTHTDAVNSAAFSHDGATIVTTSGDQARIWNAQTGTLISTLEGHTGGVTSAAFSRDGKAIVVAGLSGDNTALIWNAETGALIHTLKGHTSSVKSAAFSPDGKAIVTVSLDPTARIWNAETGTLIRTLKGHTSVVNSAAFSPDGSTIVTASWDKTARIWNAQTGTLISTLEGHTGGVTSAAFSRDGKAIVVAGLSGDNTALIWNAETGALIHTLKGHTSSVKSAAFSPDGSTIVTASGDKTALIWNAETGALIHTLKSHKSVVDSAEFSPNGTKIVTVSYDKTVIIWDLTKMEWFSAFRGHTPQPK